MAGPAPQSPQPPGTLTGEQIEALTGLTDRRVRQLAKMGYFSSPVRGLYKQTETIRGLFKYYREDRHAEAKTMHEAKLTKLRAEAEMAQIKLAETKAELIALQDVQSYLVNVSAKFDQLITQKLDVEGPARTVGKDIVALRSEFSQIHDEMRGVINAGLSGYGHGAGQTRPERSEGRCL